jgi:hypothetical protein
MAISFSMWMIDTGRADACTLGWAWEGFRYAQLEDAGVVEYTDMPEFLWHMDHFPTQFHRHLAWLDSDAWRAWLAYRRVVG